MTQDNLLNFDPMLLKAQLRSTFLVFRSLSYSDRLDLISEIKQIHKEQSFPTSNKSAYTKEFIAEVKKLRAEIGPVKAAEKLKINRQQIYRICKK